jgi:hypothetical protein
MKDILQNFFKKYPNIKFQENPSSGSWGVPHRWTDRRGEADGHFLQFRERV